MASRKKQSPSALATSANAAEHIIDIDVDTEMRESFLEYAYSVIYARALPDARDGLKPVQRRILYQMAQMGLRPDRGHVKCARVVGEVMGKLHPHGDSAIYDALVRMAQDFSFRLPLVDGHGNFGSLDNGPAAMRYTECRLESAALAMTASLDEDVVDFVPNYDGRETEPTVLPSAIPQLLVNGAAGIAVGLATNLPPHNLREIIAAARHLLRHPNASLSTLMRYVPGPDFATGGIITDMDGIQDAYETGRGTFKVRAQARIERISPRRQGIIVTELPASVGPERVIERVKTLIQTKKLDGIHALNDESDWDSGLRLVFEIKTGFNPAAVLEKLYQRTPLEENFAVNAVALVDGQPRTLSLRELLQVFLDHRVDVVRRRSHYRSERVSERLHLLEGLLIAMVDIDEVIAVIRSSDDTAAARARLQQIFDLSELQATYILDMPLRRLTKFSRLELEQEQTQLQQTLAELAAILGDEEQLKQVVSEELAEVAKEFGTDRRTLLLDGAPALADDAAPLPSAGAAAESLTVSDEPCVVFLETTGLIARIPVAPDGASAELGTRVKHDTIHSWLTTTTHAQIGVLTSAGKVHRLNVLELPALAATTAGLRGAEALDHYLNLDTGEEALALVPLQGPTPEFLLATAQGVVKRVSADVPVSLDVWPVIRLAEGDHVVTGRVIPTTAEEQDRLHVVLVSSDAKLLHFPLDTLRAQGRSAAGVAGMRLTQDAHVLTAALVDPQAAQVQVLTCAGALDTLPGTSAGRAKLTPLPEYPAKGRGTGGVRVQRFLRGEDILTGAWVHAEPINAVTGTGAPAELPPVDLRRDGAGTAVPHPIAAVGTPLVSAWITASSIPPASPQSEE